MRPTDPAILFAELLTEKFSTGRDRWWFTVTPGRTYDKVTRVDPAGNRSVHAFVCRVTGSVYKAATRDRCAPAARYPDVRAAAVAADLHGTYLYAGRAPGVDT